MIDGAVFIIVFALSILVIVAALYFVFKADTSAKVKPKAEDEADEPNVAQPRNLRRRALGRGNRFQADENEQENDGGHVEDQQAAAEAIRNDSSAAGKKIGKKKAEKLAAKAQAKREREAFQRMLEERRNAEDLEYNKRREREAEEAQIQKQIEEEEKKRQEELALQRQQEYESWKNLIVIEEKGSDALDDDAKAARINEFINFIKEKKIVLLEDLSAMFKMKMADIITLLKELDDNDRLIGVIDDRGKFICLEESELEQVSKFIQRRGRVSLQELHNECNKIIKIETELLTEKDILSDEE